MTKIENDEKIYGSSKKDKLSLTFSKTQQSICDLNFNNCLQKLDPNTWTMLFEFEEEFYRKGNLIVFYRLVWEGISKQKQCG